jgi:hypothetical protein
MNTEFISVEEVLEEIQNSVMIGYSILNSVMYTAPILKK